MDFWLNGFLPKTSAATQLGIFISLRHYCYWTAYGGVEVFKVSCCNINCIYFLIGSQKANSIRHSFIVKGMLSFTWNGYQRNWPISLQKMVSYSVSCSQIRVWISFQIWVITTSPFDIISHAPWSANYYLFSLSLYMAPFLHLSLNSLHHHPYR